MSRHPVQHRPHSLLPEFGELFTGFPPWPNLRPVFDTHLIRLEDELKDGRYQVRAEIRGVDPAKDVDTTVNDRRLTIKAEHSEKKESNGHSEFSLPVSEAESAGKACRGRVSELARAGRLRVFTDTGPRLSAFSCSSKSWETQ